MPSAAALPSPFDRIGHQNDAFCRKYGVVEFSLFGSVLRNDVGPDRDFDVLVALEPGRTLTLETYLDMLKAAQATLRHIAGRFRADHEREEMFRHAVERSIEIVGEAARRLTQAFRDANPQIPWQQVMAIRRILAHGCDEVDHDTVWHTATDRIPAQIGQLRPLLPRIPPTGE